VLAPPSAQGTPWLNRFGEVSTAFASGWMMLRGTRRRGAADRGFVVSDHADWPGLLGAIEATGASTVLATHGSTAILTRYLRERGLDARALSTPWEGERADANASTEDAIGEAE
jgi:putative mRNA 3-end processing factor